MATSGQHYMHNLVVGVIGVIGLGHSVAHNHKLKYNGPYSILPMGNSKPTQLTSLKY